MTELRKTAQVEIDKTLLQPIFLLPGNPYPVTGAIKNVGLRLRFTLLDGVHIHYNLNRNLTLNQTRFALCAEQMIKIGWS